MLALSACGGGAAPQKQEDQNPTPQNTQASLRELLAGGTPQKCIVSSGSDNAQTNGTVYVAAGKMRGDFSAVVEGGTMQSHMIALDGMAYTWVDGMGTGFKMSMAIPAATKGKEAPDLEKKVPMTCSSWLEEASLFALPNTVIFSEVTIPNAETPLPHGTVQGCAACNFLQGSQQQQCKEGLHCPP